VTLPDRVSDWEPAAWEAREERIAIMLAESIPLCVAIPAATERVRLEWLRKGPAAPQDAMKRTG
jgi:hypothetical protein